jgi:hypothetical protein
MSVLFKFAGQVKVSACSFALLQCVYCSTPWLQEEHGQPLFGVQFNWWLEDDKIFATVGSNRVRESPSEAACMREVTSVAPCRPLYTSVILMAA